MSKNLFVRTALVFLLVLAGSAGLAHAAVAPAPASSAAPSACATPDFLLTPVAGAEPVQTTAARCGCGDAICLGVVPLGSCGTHRVCVATGSCGTAVSKSCACVTQDPPR